MLGYPVLRHRYNPGNADSKCDAANRDPRNVPKASPSENVPVKAAATAKRMQTRPEASLSRDSPSRMCIKRLGTGTRAAIADTAIGSVGETIAASAKAMATGISGIIQLIKKPTPTTVNTTRPSASSKIVPLVAEQTLLGNAPAVQKEKRRQKQQEEDIRLQCNAEIGHRGDDRAKCDLNERMDAYCENHYPRSLAFLVRLLLYIATRWGLSGCLSKDFDARVENRTDAPDLVRHILVREGAKWRLLV